MSNRARSSEEDARMLIIAITDFLRDQLTTRTDLVAEDRDCLEIAIQCLEMAYELDPNGYIQFRFARPLLDIFTQVTNPVSVRDKLRAEGHKDEGNAFMSRSMYENAEVEYTHAIELDRWNAIYYCNRASARIEQQNFFEAIADCRQALLLNPDYAKAHARMGQSYALIHRPREAARCFRQALEMDPGNERYRNNLRVAENQINRPDAMEFITNLLSSFFDMTPQTETRGDSNVTTIPPSLMIITESHPPIIDTSDLHSTESTDKSTSTGGELNLSQRNIIYPRPYGVIDVGAEEQPVKIDIPIDIDTSLPEDERGIEVEFQSPFCQCEKDEVSEDAKNIQVTTQSPQVSQDVHKTVQDVAQAKVSPTKIHSAERTDDEIAKLKDNKSSESTEPSKSTSGEKLQGFHENGKPDIAVERSVTENGKSYIPEPKVVSENKEIDITELKAVSEEGKTSQDENINPVKPNQNLKQPVGDTHILHTGNTADENQNVPDSEMANTTKNYQHEISTEPAISFEAELLQTVQNIMDYVQENFESKSSEETNIQENDKK